GGLPGERGGQHGGGVERTGAGLRVTGNDSDLHVDLLSGEAFRPSPDIRPDVCVGSATEMWRTYCAAGRRIGSSRISADSSKQPDSAVRQRVERDAVRRRTAPDSATATTSAPP